MILILVVRRYAFISSNVLAPLQSPFILNEPNIYLFQRRPRATKRGCWPDRARSLRRPALYARLPQLCPQPFPSLRNVS